jgi:hypothetical protein
MVAAEVQVNKTCHAQQVSIESEPCFATRLKSVKLVKLWAPALAHLLE